MESRWNCANDKKEGVLKRGAGCRQECTKEKTAVEAEAVLSSPAPQML